MSPTKTHEQRHILSMSTSPQNDSYKAITQYCKVRKRIAVGATSIAPLRELTCHMGSHMGVTCHQAEVTFSPLPQPIKAGTRFSDPRGMQG